MLRWLYCGIFERWPLTLHDIKCSFNFLAVTDDRSTAYSSTSSSSLLKSLSRITGFFLYRFIISIIFGDECSLFSSLTSGPLDVRVSNALMSSSRFSLGSFSFRTIESSEKGPSLPKLVSGVECVYWSSVTYCLSVSHHGLSLNLASGSQCSLFTGGNFFFAYIRATVVGGCVRSPLDRYSTLHAALVEVQRMMLEANDAEWSICAWYQCGVGRFICIDRIALFLLQWCPVNRHYLHCFEDQGFSCAFIVPLHKSPFAL